MNNHYHAKHHIQGKERKNLTEKHNIILKARWFNRGKLNLNPLSIICMHILALSCKFMYWNYLLCAVLMQVSWSPNSKSVFKRNGQERIIGNYETHDFGETC